MIIGAVALVLGVVLGGLLPRAEVRRLEHEIEDLQAKECRPALGSEFAELLMRPPILSDPDALEPEPQPEPVPDASPETPPTDAAPPVDELETAKTALRLRTTQARAALVEDAAPDEEQMDTFDAAVDDMNADLRDLAEEVVARFDEGGEPTRREMMVFAADVLDVMITAEDRMAESFDPEQREATDGAALDPFSYIDPTLLDLLSELGP